MGVSESKTIEVVESNPPSRNVSDGVSLSSLRSQFTSSKSMSLDQAKLGSARFRQEERLRADIRREKRLRQQAIDERIIAMKESVAVDLAVGHELTLDALEKEKSNNTLKGDLIKNTFVTSSMGVSYKVKLGKSI